MCISVLFSLPCLVDAALNVNTEVIMKCVFEGCFQIDTNLSLKCDNEQSSAVLDTKVCALYLKLS